MSPRASTDAAADRAVALLRALALFGAAGYVLLYAVLACLRVRYPFELEWLEGAMVDHVRTILDGKPLYAKPALDFIPLTYTPGYFYLAAAICKVVGLGLIPLRVISIVASAGILGLTVRLVALETGDWRAGMLAAGLFAAMFGWTAGWLDLARNDSLFLCLAILAIYVLRRAPSTRGAVLAGVLISLSFLTKQTGLIVAVPLAAWCALCGWRMFAGFAGTALVLIGGTSVLFQWLFDGWYRYYVFDVPNQHPVAMQSIVGFWRYDVVGPLPIAFAFAVVYLAWRLLRGERRTAIFYLLVSVGFFAGAWISRLHSLSFINVVLPAYLATAIVFAIAVHDIAERLTSSTMPHRRAWVAAIFGLCLLQLGRVAYRPASFVPTAQDVATGQEFVERLSRMPGRIFVPFHGYLPRLAGKESFAHAVMISDVIRGGTTDVEKGLADELARALRTHQFDSVVAIESRTPVHEWLPIVPAYEPAEAVIAVPPVSGGRSGDTCPNDLAVLELRYLDRMSRAVARRFQTATLLVVLALLLAPTPADAQGTDVTAPPARRLDGSADVSTSAWRGALADSLRLLAIEHGIRIAFQEKTRSELAGPFAHDYLRSIRAPRTWEDGDNWLVNYLGHPIHGAAASRVWLDHSPQGRRLDLSLSPSYWASRGRAAAWGAIYSIQFEFGPVSEASLGNVGMRPGTTGWVNHVVTPAGALAFTVAEDALDKYFVRWVETKTGNRVFHASLRMLFSPSWTMANLAEGRAPWHRPTRPLR